MAAPYKTLQKTASDEIVINKSRFIADAAPCETEEDALRFLASIKAKYKDANHHCYAYVIGRNAGIMRYSDDGEPGGTAGLPMMEVLKNKQLVNCCVVVTRYFGGILLGAGGLVRAYTQGAVIGVNAAAPVMMEPSCTYLCEVPYSLWDRVQYTMKSLPVQLKGTEFTTAVAFSIMTRTKDADTVLETLSRVTDGKLEYLPEDESFEAWSLEEGNS